MIVRAISALIGILLLVLIGFFYNEQGIIIFCSLVSMIACYEYAKMFLPHHLINKILFFTLSFSLHLLFSYFTQNYLLITSYLFLIVLLFIFQRKLSPEERFTNISSWTLGIFYCGLLTGVIVVGTHQFQMEYFLAILIASFSTDTMAYLGGKFLGKHPLAPKISPNKTIEGGICGLLAGSLATYFYLNSLNHTSPILMILLFSVVASFFSQIGDLFESMLKRIFGIKDSGKILPGHGGALDRIDGLLFSAPIIFLWMNLYVNT